MDLYPSLGEPTLGIRAGLHIRLTSSEVSILFFVCHIFRSLTLFVVTSSPFSPYIVVLILQLQIETI